MADIGVATTEKIIDDLREKVKEQKIKEISVCRELFDPFDQRADVCRRDCL